MSCWTKEELDDLLFKVVEELDLSETMLEKHGPMGTEPPFVGSPLSDDWPLTTTPTGCPSRPSPHSRKHLSRRCPDA